MLYGVHSGEMSTKQEKCKAVIAVKSVAHDKKTATVEKKRRGHKNEKTKARTPPSIWTDQELKILYERVNKYKGDYRMWVVVAAGLPNRSRKEVRQRYMRDMRSDRRYKRWTMIEERDLYEHVLKFGESRWNEFTKNSDRPYFTVRNHWFVMRKHAEVAAEQSPELIMDAVSAYLDSRAEKEQNEVWE